MTKGFTWDSTAVYSAQQYCAYETVALGYSKWCSLFSYKEWEYFEYAIDLVSACIAQSTPELCDEAVDSEQC